MCAHRVLLLPVLENRHVYFQCSGVDPDSGDVTTALCFMALPTKVGDHPSWVNAAVEPMSYGFAGMKFVTFTE